MAPHLQDGSAKPTLSKSYIQNSAKKLVYQSEKQQPSKNLYFWNKYEIVWRNVLIFIILHFFGVYGGYLLLFKSNWATFIWFWTMGVFCIEGTGAAAHRLWAHRTYKAKLPLRILFMIFQTITGQNHIYEWCRDHRVHHKFVDTDADPHNSRLGFFFSHMGWLLVKKHEAVKIKGKTVDLSDLEADPVVMFQKRHYYPLVIIFAVAIPTLVPWYFFGEQSLLECFYVSTIFRYVYSLHLTWLVNSAAHMWGSRPYDIAIYPTENVIVSALTWGEGWHNYHHIFPWDYKAAELGNYTLNLTTAFIDFFSYIGWAYDLKTVSPEMIQKRIARTGKRKLLKNKVDGDHNLTEDETLWGWGDTQMKPETKEEIVKHNNLKIM